MSKPPPTRVDVIEESLHGVNVKDPYRWLENEKASEVQAWMKSWNAYTRGYLADLPHRQAWFERAKSLIYVEVRTPPMVRGGRLFFSRKAADQEKSVHYWQEGETGTPQVLIDPLKLDQEGKVSIGGVIPSHDGKLVAYIEHANNADEGRLKIMRVDTKEILEDDTIAPIRYSWPSWTPDNRGFYYTWTPSDPSIPPAQRMGYAEVRFHTLGTSPQSDRVVHEKLGDPERFISAYVSDDGAYLFLSISHGWSEEDLYVQFLGKDDPKTWRKLAVGTKSRYQVQAYEGRLYIATNYKAPRWRVFAVDPENLEREAWKLVVPEHGSAVLKNMNIVGGKLGLDYLDKAVSFLEIRDLNGKRMRQVKLPDLGTSSGFIGQPEDDTAYYTFASFTRPFEVYQTSIATGETQPFARVDAPIEPDWFVSKQVRYPSKDGTEISMFLVHRKDVKLDGKQPTLLYGYGGFNISLTPSFSALVYSFIESGGLYAMANLRGGGEYGEAWHQAGMLENKQNVFDDFVAAAEWLTSQGHAHSDRLAIYGRSNGGLLVGAAMTQRPDLFSAVVCGVPLLDMVRYHRFGLGSAWIPEYGSADEAKQFPWLYAYSPYHRVAPDQNYPALLMLSADHDDRVDPMHARKFVAAVDAVAGKPVLLRIESDAGHGGADLRSRSVEEVADFMAFIFAQLQVSPKAL